MAGERREWEGVSLGERLASKGCAGRGCTATGFSRVLRVSISSFLVPSLLLSSPHSLPSLPTPLVLLFPLPLLAIAHGHSPKRVLQPSACTEEPLVVEKICSSRVGVDVVLGANLNLLGFPERKHAFERLLNTTQLS